ncbi:MAG: hypothetical protein ACHRHE_07550 [Tepidisphaerales bacterium]
MFVKAMAVIYGIAGDTTAENPTWELVEATLQSLDGEGCDGVSLDSIGDSCMGISGGNDGRYVVAGYLKGFGNFICASGESAGPAKDVAVAGDFNSYASINVVSIQTAIAAAKAFCEGGVLSEHLVWEKEP